MASELIEESVLRELSGRGLAPQRWSNGPGAVYGVHDHPYAKVLYCVEGSIEFQLPDENKVVAMRPGDWLDLPPRTPHSAVVGSQGVVCVEAHRNLEE